MMAVLSPDVVNFLQDLKIKETQLITNVTDPAASFGLTRVFNVIMFLVNVYQES